MKSETLIKALRGQIAAPVGNRTPILIEGAPGIGKTECARQAAAAEGATLHNPNAEVTDPIDVGGFPRINGADSATYTRPWIMPALGDVRPAVLFIDEADKMLPSAQAAWLSVIQNREVHGHKLGDNVAIVLAANRASDRAGGHRLITPLRSRVAAVTMETDVEAWSRWALSADVALECVAFNRFRPELHHAFDPKADGAFPCPRSHVAVSKLLKVGHDCDAERELIIGTVGEGCGVEYLGFLRVWRQLPSPDAIILAPDSAPVPTDPATVYALCGALARKASDTNAGAIFKYLNRLPAEFGVFGVASTVRRTPSIQSTRAFIDWSARNSAVLI